MAGGDFFDLYSDIEASKALDLGALWEDLAGGIEDTADAVAGSVSAIAWVERNRVIRGRPFRFDDAGVQVMRGERDPALATAPRPYLTQYIADNCPEKSVIKCRQSEFTENEINQNLFLCSTRPFTNVRHIFPTAGMAQQIAREKISTAIHESPRIDRMVRKPDTFTIKEFTNGSFYTIDGSWTDHQGRGPSSDKLVYDEYESHNPKIEEIFSESTSHSQLGLKVRISTPLFPNGGIDQRFKEGCGYEWHVTCQKCGREQTLDFPDSVVGFFERGNCEIDSEEYVGRLNKAYIGCRFCKEPLDRTSKHYLATSRWVARKPQLVGMKNSYRVTYMMLPWKTGKEILFKYHTFKYLHQFYNEVVGLAYLSPENKVTKASIEACQDLSYVNQFQAPANARNVTVGVDWGYTSWVVVRGDGIPPNERRPRVLYVERIDEQSLRANGFPSPTGNDHAKRVCQIVDRFGPKLIVNDANGIGADRNSALMKRYPGKSFGAFYDTQETATARRRVSRVIDPQWQEAHGKVVVSRVATLKAMIQEYNEGVVAIPRLDNDVAEFVDHHASLVVSRMVDDETDAEYEIIGHVGPDHYAHADNYAKIAYDRLTAGGHVRAPVGII